MNVEIEYTFIERKDAQRTSCDREVTLPQNASRNLYT